MGCESYQVVWNSNRFVRINSWIYWLFQHGARILLQWIGVPLKFRKRAKKKKWSISFLRSTDKLEFSQFIFFCQCLYDDVFFLENWLINRKKDVQKYKGYTSGYTITRYTLGRKTYMGEAKGTYQQDRAKAKPRTCLENPAKQKGKTIPTCWHIQTYLHQI